MAETTDNRSSRNTSSPSVENVGDSGLISVKSTRRGQLEGSVFEFAFGNEPHSYFATSYPYPADSCSNEDYRIPEFTSNVPDSLQNELSRRRPWFIMNLSITTNGDWFMYAYKKRGYYRAWSYKDGPDGKLRDVLDALMRENKDENGVSLCSFGECPESFFVRATYERNDKLVWYPRWGLLPWTCSVILQSKLDGAGWKEGPPRSITFGYGNRWLMYGKSWFEWSTNLPPKLKMALFVAKAKLWTINKAVLSLRNPHEYVVVFNEGPVYSCFHSDFLQKFHKVANEWSAGMREAGNLKHEHDLPNNYIPSDKLDEVQAQQLDDENDFAPQEQQAMTIHQIASAPEARDTPSSQWYQQPGHSPPVAHSTGHIQYDNASLRFKTTPSGVPSTVQPHSSVSNQTPADEYSQAAFLKQETLYGVRSETELDLDYQFPNKQLHGSVRANTGHLFVDELPSIPGQGRRSEMPYRPGRGLTSEIPPTPNRVESKGWKIWQRGSSDEKKNNNGRRS